MKMMYKNIKLFCRICTVILLCQTFMLYFQIGTSAASYDPTQDFTVKMLKITDDSGNAISDVRSVSSPINISAVLRNANFARSSVCVMSSVYDPATNQMKLAKVSDAVYVDNGFLGSLNLQIPAESLQQAGAAPGDKLKLYFWDSLTGMQQMRNSLSSADFVSQPTKYTTNNIIDYNKSKNELRGDNWTYIQKYVHLSSYAPPTAKAMGGIPLLSQTAAQIANGTGTWYIDPVNKTSNWYLKADGSITAEAQRTMGFNYTIGANTAGKQLNITVTLTKESVNTTQVWVLKTSDTAYDQLLYDDANWYTNNLITEFVSDTTQDKTVTFTIPSNKVIAGNDITFFVDRYASGTTTSKISITIEAQ